MVATPAPLPLLLLSAASRSCGAFAPPRARPAAVVASRRYRPLGVAQVSRDDGPSPSPSTCDGAAPPLELRLEARASSGLPPGELSGVLGAVASVCEEYGLPFDSGSVQCSEAPARPESVPGALGRALLIGVPPGFDVDNDELIAQVKLESSQRIDDVLYRDGESRQPILLAFTSRGDEATSEDMIAKEVLDYGLRDAVNQCEQRKVEENSFNPSVHVEIDGALIESVDSPGQTHFDTSSVLVFDNLLDDSLRKRLLNVVKGNPEKQSNDEWNDIENGPDPSRWVRGGLMDVVGDNSDEAKNDADDGPCWGLTDEAIMDICYGNHPAIAEFESRLSQLFPDFIVSRLPEAVLGGCVSALTANAPTHGDTFEYHIDADPLQVPPSPWADVFGRYPNRSRGKPRFVSCLLYLNDVWEESWGAPTRFLDPPTQQTHEVFPRPGRCVIMDQDVSHTVVAPNFEARRRPRYSLVWKLILHPRKESQDTKDLSCGRKWPEEPVLIGSAKLS